MIRDIIELLVAICLAMEVAYINASQWFNMLAFKLFPAALAIIVMADLVARYAGLHQ